MTATVWFEAGMALAVATSLVLLFRTLQRTPGLRTGITATGRALATLPWTLNDAQYFLLAYLGIQFCLSAVRALAPEATLTGSPGLTAALQLTAITLPPLLLAILLKRKLTRWNLRPREVFCIPPEQAVLPQRPALMGVMLCLAAIPVIGISDSLFRWVLSWMGFETALQDIVQTLMTGHSPALRLSLGVLGVTVIPVAEEILFRGVILTAALKHTSPPRAVLYTSLFFAALHLHVPSFPALFLLSLALSLGYLLTGSLRTPIIMHILFNALTVFTLLISGTTP